MKVTKSANVITGMHPEIKPRTGLKVLFGFGLLMTLTSWQKDIENELIAAGLSGGISDLPAWLEAVVWGQILGGVMLIGLSMVLILARDMRKQKELIEEGKKPRHGFWVWLQAVVINSILGVVYWLAVNALTDAFMS